MCGSVCSVVCVHVYVGVGEVCMWVCPAKDEIVPGSRAAQLMHSADKDKCVVCACACR